MSKVNFTFDITDEMLDEAAQQLIKNRVRQAVSAAMEKQVASLVEQTIDSRVKDIVNSLNSRYQWGTCARKLLEARIKEKIAEMEISDEKIMAGIADIFVAASVYAKEKMDEVDSYVRSKTYEIDSNYASQVTKKAENLMKEFAGAFFAEYIKDNQEEAENAN